LIAALRNTVFAVQSFQDAAKDAAATQATMFRSDLKKCRRNRRIPHTVPSSMEVSSE
jgi:hypothetical protein